MARHEKDVGYKAVLVKEQYITNADRAQTINKLVPYIHFFGGIVLNHHIGDLNPFSVEAEIRFGAKEV